jgi:hypothetical protein
MKSLCVSLLPAFLHCIFYFPDLVKLAEKVANPSQHVTLCMKNLMRFIYRLSFRAEVTKCRFYYWVNALIKTLTHAMTKAFSKLTFVHHPFIFVFLCFTSARSFFLDFETNFKSQSTVLYKYASLLKLNKKRFNLQTSF